MNSYRKLVVVLMTLAGWLAMCRPAPADTFQYGFSVSDLKYAINEDVAYDNAHNIDSSQSFGGGACGDTGAFSALCGVWGIIATPNVSEGDITSASIDMSASIGSASWTTEILQTVTTYPPPSFLPQTLPLQPQAVSFFADVLSESIHSGSDSFISFLTDNTNTVGTDFSNLTDHHLTGAPPLANSALFSIRLTSSDLTTLAEASNVTWSLEVYAEGLDASGVLVGKPADDVSLIGFQMEATVFTPEPASGWLCPIGLAAWGIIRKLRQGRAESARLSGVAGRFRGPRARFTCQVK